MLASNRNILVSPERELDKIWFFAIYDSENFNSITNYHFWIYSSIWSDSYFLINVSIITYLKHEDDQSYQKLYI